jgi:hypothetical protein
MDGGNGKVLGMVLTSSLLLSHLLCDGVLVALHLGAGLAVLALLYSHTAMVSDSLLQT